ncbi:MAG: anti-sigma factor RsbA family regulatory protein, partial [Pseudonocardiaceae bacterium]
MLHEAVLYSSTEEFLSVTVPFLTGGANAGEPTIAVFGQGNAELIRAELGDTTDIALLDARTHYTRPASAIKTYRKVLAELIAEGAHRIRVVGEIPHVGTSRPWEWWARYEATLNHAFEDFPLWVLCAYDTRAIPAEIRADVVRTHPHLLTADGRHATNPRFEDPASFLTRSPACGADPLEATPPTIDLLGPTPASARRAVHIASRTSHLDHTEVADMVYIVNEAVTNAICHGLPPIHLRIWSGPHRIVATVTDQGPGPTDPFVGLLPPPDNSSTGLWLIHQIGDHVTLSTDNEGFTIRLVTSTPNPQPNQE